MSNPLAIDANVLSAVDKPRYLKVDGNGLPLNKQVPRSYQRYSGTGGSLNYDGSNELLIFSDLLVAPLNVVLGPTISVIRSLIGRYLVLHVLGTSAQPITVTSTPALMVVSGTPGSTNSYVLPGGGIYKTVTIYFASSSQFVVDSSGMLPSGLSVSNVGGGVGTIFRDITSGTVNLKTLDPGTWMDIQNGSSLITISNAYPKIYPGNSVYPYGESTVVSVLVARIGASSYLATLIPPDPDDEGTVTMIDDTATGPVPFFLTFQFAPAPRLTRPVTVRFLMQQTFPPVDAEFTATVTLRPNKVNVNDIEYVRGTRAGATTLGMYLTTANAFGSRDAQYESGGDVTLSAAGCVIATNIQDNITFFAVSGSTVIQYQTHSDSGGGTLLDVSTLTVQWTVGGVIRDLEYSERDSCLYVMPATGNHRLLLIPILPYKAGDGTVRMGPIGSRALTFGAADVMHSMAVCQNTSFVYFSRFSQISLTVQVSLTAAATTTYTIVISWDSLIGTGRSSLAFGSRGTLCLLFETGLTFRTIAPGKGISDGFTTVYTLPEFLPSMSRNCYGQFPL